jgi:hypothetical protein
MIKRVVIPADKFTAILVEGVRELKIPSHPRGLQSGEHIIIKNSDNGMIIEAEIVLLEKTKDQSFFHNEPIVNIGFRAFECYDGKKRK